MEQITVEQLAAKVLEMRTSQVGYFKTPQNEYVAKANYLKLSKALEKEVDALCSQVLHPENKNQISLF